MLLLASLVISLLAVIAVWLASRHDPAGSPLLTLGSLLLLLALPAFMVLPKLTVTLPAFGGAGAAGTTVIPLFGLLWLAGLALLALRDIWSHLGLHGWKRRSVIASHPRLKSRLADCRRRLAFCTAVQLRLHPTLGSPAVTGLFRPTIYLPAHAVEWNDDTLRMVLLHELGHLARRDLWTALTARLACLLHWFNPLVWVLRKHLLAQCEYACDAHVIASGANRDIYAHALCDVAEQASAPRGLLAMAGRAPLRQRVERLIEQPRSTRPWLVGTALVVTFTTALALSIVRFSPAETAAVSHGAYSPAEISLRHSANPFPGN
jgi:beta-lactamase regulating signal transducer with metallopeptidase domain